MCGFFPGIPPNLIMSYPEHNEALTFFCVWMGYHELFICFLPNFDGSFGMINDLANLQSSPDILFEETPEEKVTFESVKSICSQLPGHISILEK